MNNKVINIAVIFFALLMALMLGQWVVTDPTLAGAVIAAGGAIATFAILRQHVWILIPAFGALTISFPWIPGYFSPQELAVLSVLGCCPLLFVVQRQLFKLRMTALEFMAIVVMLFLLQSFVRNPAGIRMFGGEYVGGRPYFIVFISFLGGMVLAATNTDIRRITTAYRLALLCYLGSVCIQAVAQLSAKAAAYTSVLFGTYSGQSSSSSGSDDGRAGRNSAARTLAELAGSFLVTNRNPLRALLHPFWMSVLAAAIIGAGMSGYRNVIASTGLTLLLGAFYWGRFRAVVLALTLAICGYLVANVVNLAVPLPAKVQRGLSFLPGTWEKDQIADAQSSTEWRVEMWEAALTTDYYIENKIMGDGLGIRRHDWEMMMEMKYEGMVTDEMSQERAMLAGDFHSGPVTTIRVIGYVGLFFFLIAQIVLAVRAHRMIMRSRGTEYFRMALFFCIPMVWNPIFFIFVFGSFKSAAPLLFLHMGLLRLFETSFTHRLDRQNEKIELPNDEEEHAAV